MRFLSFILSIVILVQTCLPCADVHACIKAGSGKNEVLTTTPIESQDSHSDMCSPFCQCSCCSCAAVAPKAKQLEFPYVAHPQLVYSLFSADQPIEISLPVWQPPQLV